MKNIWYIFGVTIFIMVGLIIIGIIIYVKKEKYYKLSETFIIFGVIFLFIESIPYVKDLTEQETTVITAVYEEYQIVSAHSMTRRLILKNEDFVYEIISPIITKIHVKMEIGKTYRIEYYNNTKIIKDYILIE